MIFADGIKRYYFEEVYDAVRSLVATHSEGISAHDLLQQLWFGKRMDEGSVRSAVFLMLEQGLVDLGQEMKLVWKGENTCPTSSIILALNGVPPVR